MRNSAPGEGGAVLLTQWGDGKIRSPFASAGAYVCLVTVVAWTYDMRIAAKFLSFIYFLGTGGSSTN